MAFKFARGVTTKHPDQEKSGSKSTIIDKAATKTNNNNNNNNNKIKTTSQPPAWLKDGPALRKAYYGSLGQVQPQPDLFDKDNKRLTNGLDKLVSLRRQDFSWDNFTDSSRLKQLLSTSRLPNSSLAAIWAHCNKTRPGVLTNREVCLALGLIAIFQRVQDQKLKDDPFSLLRLEKFPPVPKLYGTDRETPTRSRIPSSSSAPNDLLIDVSGGTDSEQTSTRNNKYWVDSSDENCAISLIDLDSGERFEPTLVSLKNVWSRLMVSMQSLFKRSFDVLNVEASRSSAIEALSSAAGVRFVKHFSLCYPIAHNIKFKLDELRGVQSKYKQPFLFDDHYSKHIDDIMVSINEYWAVLINLFHASGQTDFIELIMDGLAKPQAVSAIRNETFDEFISGLAIRNKCDTCAICLSEFYLVNMGDALERGSRLDQEDLDTLYDTRLISSDENFYYHPKCANFWLNNVPESNGMLPFEASHPKTETILEPIK